MFFKNLHCMHPCNIQNVHAGSTGAVHYYQEEFFDTFVQKIEVAVMHQKVFGIRCKKNYKI